MRPREREKRLGQEGRQGRRQGWQESDVGRVRGEDERRQEHLFRLQQQGQVVQAGQRVPVCPRVRQVQEGEEADVRVHGLQLNVSVGVCSGASDRR